MLQSLTIENVVVVDFVHIDFNTGFSVFTGETGAGKSILLDSLSLVLGDRAQTHLIREGKETASVSAHFHGLPKKVCHLLKDHGFVLEGTDLIIRRVLSRAGRNQIFVNDIPLSLNLLNQITPHLIDVHGQFDQILVNQNHIHYLDQFAGINKNALSESFLAWKQAEKELRSAEEKEVDKEERLIVLRAHIESLQKLSPKNDEEEELLSKKKLPNQVKKLQI